MSYKIVQHTLYKKYFDLTTLILNCFVSYFRLSNCALDKPLPPGSRPPVFRGHRTTGGTKEHSILVL